jgi:thiosulfate dehydrogenase
MQRSCVAYRIGRSALLLAWLTLSTAAAAQQPAVALGPPEDAIPDGPVGEAIRLGQKILRQTPAYAARYSGSALTCTNCHTDGGRTPYASPWVGIWGVFPEYRSRNARVNLLEDRINDCFERSMNGRALALDSQEMRAILAYMRWISTGVPTGQDGPGRGFRRITSPAPADPKRGQRIYADKCAVCHGQDGEGTYGAQGETVFPPLWGPRSFNLGAGMARLNTAAAFVKVSMPLGQGGTLTDQEAFDVAAYFTQQPRPDFAGKRKDWPQGDKPEDARY